MIIRHQTIYFHYVSDQIRNGVLRDPGLSDPEEKVQNFCCTGPYDGEGNFFTWFSEAHVLGLQIDDIDASQGFAVNVEILGQANIGPGDIGKFVYV